MELRDLVASAEPPELRRWIAEISPERKMVQGSTTRLIDNSWSMHEGLYVPTPTTSPVLEQVQLYLTLREYVPSITNQQLARIVHEIVDSYPKEQLLLELAQLNVIQERADVMSDLAQHYSSTLTETLSHNLDAAIDRRQTHHHRLLSRQGILAAMRLALAGPDTPSQRSQAPSHIGAIALVHAVSALLSSPDRKTEHELMMELVSNLVFNARQEPHELIFRHLELWEDIGDTCTSDPTPAELVESILGLQLRDLLAFAFAVSSWTISWEPGRTLVVDHKLLGVGRTQSDIDAFLARTAATVHELQAAFAASSGGPWDYLAIQNRPILRLSNGNLVILDLAFLFQRVTEALYWDVHESVSTTGGKKARVQWTMKYGKMVEEFAIRRLPHLAPGGLDHDTYYGETQLRTAYPRSKVVDGLIEMGKDWLAIEVVSGRLTIASWISGDASAFRSDVNKIVLDKAKQLDALSKRLIRDESPLTGRGHFPGRRVQPLLVAGAGFPIEPLSGRLILRELQSRRLLQDPRIAPLAIITLEELDMLRALATSGHDPASLVAAWQRSDGRSIALRSWLLANVGTDRSLYERPSEQQAWDRLVRDLVDRLRLQKEA